MVQPDGESDHRARVMTTAARTALADSLLAVKGLQLHVEVFSEPPDPAGWLDAAALSLPEAAPLATLLQRFQASGFGFNRRAAAASLLLRYGWGAGFAVAVYLVRARVPFLRDYAMHFSAGSLLKWLWIRDAQFVGRPNDPFAGAPDFVESVSEDGLRRRLLESLVSFTEPVVASQHAWSRFSRHALWSMAASSWAGQFANVARQLGDEARGVTEARATLALAPEIARAAPELYEVKSGGAARTCQRMRACCLYFKSSNRRFCASCPIIPEAERLQRNRIWIAQQEAHAG